MNLNFKDKTAFTSPEYSFGGPPGAPAEVWIGVTGDGPVYIDVKCEDGEYRTYPELTFETTTAQRVAVKRGRFRLRVNAAAPTTVELSW